MSDPTFLNIGLPIKKPDRKCMETIQHMNSIITEGDNFQKQRKYTLLIWL